MKNRKSLSPSLYDADLEKKLNSLKDLEKDGLQKEIVKLYRYGVVCCNDVLLFIVIVYLIVEIDVVLKNYFLSKNVLLFIVIVCPCVEIDVLLKNFIYSRYPIKLMEY